MSTLVDVLQPLHQPDVVETTVVQPEASPISTPELWDPARFAEAQIYSLVRQVFFPGHAKAPRHIVFSAVDASTYVAEICMEVGKALSAQVTGSVCVVEANPYKSELEDVFWRRDEPVSADDAPDSLRSASQNIMPNLWLAPREILLGANSGRPSADTLARRLSDFRLEFDYTIFHGPPAGCYAEAALLGHLSDGVALVLEANSTRRVAAQKTKEILQAARARLLGVVLSERTFPIPASIYRKL
jgi:hypothetical protein